MISIDIDTQTLSYKDKTYLISSAKNGVGEVEGSYCTPRGRFQIAQKMGMYPLIVLAAQVFPS